MALIVNGEYVDDAAIREEAAAMRPALLDAMAGEDPIAVEMRVQEWAREI